MGDILERYIRQHEEKVAFIKTPRFAELTELFKDAVARDGVIDGEQVKYHPEEYPFTPDEFRMAVESVFANYEPVEIPGEEGTFPRFASNYQGLGFAVLVGQGSVYAVQEPFRGITDSLDI